MERKLGEDVGRYSDVELQRDFETSWQPDGDTFLLPHSVGDNAIKTGLFVREDDARTTEWEHLYGTYAARPSPAGLENYRYIASDRGLEFQSVSSVWQFAGSFPLRVTSLPASPIDGEVVHFVPDNGTWPDLVWVLRWRSAASRWDYLGGSPYVLNPGTFTTANTGFVFTNLAASWTWTPPKGGRYRVSWAFRVRDNTAAAAQISSRVVYSGFAKQGGENNLPAFSLDWSGGKALTTEQANGVLLNMQYYSTVANLTFEDAQVEIEPLYLLN